jgi:hypothetical protein
LGPSSNYKTMLEAYQKTIPELNVKDEMIAFDEVFHIQKNASVNIILEAKSEISPFLPAKFPHCIEANKQILSLAPYYSETRRLLGDDYQYWSEVDNELRISQLMEQLYDLWKEDSDNLLLNRVDLQEYLSVDYLKQTIDNLKK